MSDFLLTGRVNTAQIVKDITNAVKTANERLKDIKVTINTKEARSKIQSLRNLMSKEIKVDINTREARNKIAALKKEIEAATAGFKTGIASTPSPLGGAGGRPQAGGSAAQQASAFGSASASVQRTVDLLKTLGEQSGKTTGQVGKLTGTVTKFDNAIISAGSSIGGPLAKGLGVADDLFGSLGVNVFLSTLRLSAFAAAGTLVFGVGRALTDAVRQTIDLDQALTSINKVLNLSTGQLTNFRNELIKTAKESATSVEQVTEATIVFAQQGLSAKDIIEAVKASLLAVNASGVTFNDAVELLTVSVNSFGKSFGEASSIIERLSTIADITAADVGDLTTILARAGSTSDAAGVSLEQLAAVGAVVRESTRLSAETIGAAFKTIFVNVQANEKVLNDFGIATRDFSGNFLGVSKILEIASVKFQGFNEEQKVALASLLTGKRRTTELIAILNGFAKASEVQAEALASSGSASAKQAQQLETLSSRLAKVSAQFTELVNTLSESGGKDILKGIVDVFSTVLGQINNFTSVLASVPGLIPAAALVAVFKLIIPPITKSIDALRKLKDEHFASGGAAVRAANETVLALESVEQKQLQVIENARRQKALEKQPSSALVPTRDSRGAVVASLNVPQITADDLKSQKDLNAILERRRVHEKAIHKELEKTQAQLNKTVFARSAELQLIKAGLGDTQRYKNLSGEIFALQDKVIDLRNKENILVAQRVQAQRFVTAQLKAEAAESQRNVALSVSFAGIVASGFAETIIQAKEATGSVSVLGRGLKSVADGAVTAGTLFSLLPAALGPIGVKISVIVGLVRAAVGVFEIFIEKANEANKKLEVARSITNEILVSQRQSATLEQQILSLNSGSTEDLEKRNELVKQFAENISSTLNNIREKTGKKNFFIPPPDVISADIENALNSGIRFSDLPVVQIKTEILRDELDKQLQILRSKITSFNNEIAVSTTSRIGNIFSGAFEDITKLPTSTGDFVKKGFQIGSLITAGIQPALAIFGLNFVDTLFPEAALQGRVADFSNGLAEKIKQGLDPKQVFSDTEADLRKQLDSIREQIARFDLGEAPTELTSSFDEITAKLNTVRSAQLKYSTTINQTALALVQQAESNISNLDSLDEITAAQQVHTSVMDQLEKQFKETGAAGSKTFQDLLDAVLKLLQSKKLEAVGSTIDKSIKTALAGLDRISDRQKNAKILLDAEISADSLARFAKETASGTKIIGSLERQLSDAQQRFDSLSKTQAGLRKNISESATALADLSNQLVSAGTASREQFGEGARVNKEFLDTVQQLRAVGGVDLLAGTDKARAAFEQIASIISVIDGRIEELAKKSEGGIPGGATELIKKRVEDYNKLREKLVDIVSGIKDINDVSKELGEAQIDVKVGKINLEFRQRELQLDAKIRATEIELDRKLLSVDIEKKISDITNDVKGRSLEFVADINLDRAIEKVEASNDKFKITSILNLNVRAVEEAFKREVELAKQVRDQKVSFLDREHEAELAKINSLHAIEVARINATAESDEEKADKIARKQIELGRERSALEIKFARDKFDAELNLAKDLADETFKLEQAKIEKLSSAFERAVDEINSLKSDIGQTENDVVSQLLAVASAQDNLNQAIFRFGDAAADYNQKIAEARFEALDAASAVREFADGLSFEDKLKSLNSVLNQSIRLIGGNEQKILEIRKRFTEESIEIFKDQINELRSIGEQGFTASAEELLSRQVARSIGEAIKASPDIARNFSAAAGGEQLSRDLLAVAKEQAQLGDRSLLDILSQAGLDILGVNGNIEELTNKLVDLGTQQAGILVKLAELDTEQLNQSRAGVSTAQQQLASDRERLANLQGLLAAQKQRLVDASNQAQFIGKKLNEARAAIDESKVAIVNAILRQAAEAVNRSAAGTSSSLVSGSATSTSSNLTSAQRTTDERLRQANLLGLLDSGPFAGGLFGSGASAGPGQGLFTGGFNVVSGLDTQGAQTGFNLNNTLAGLEAEGELARAAQNVRDNFLQVFGATGSMTIALETANALLEDFARRTSATPNFASGSLSASESAGLLMAARREKQQMPGGSRLGVFNTSETVLTRKQANLLLGTKPRGNVISAAEGNIGEVGGISELITLVRDLLNQMRSGGNEKVDVNLTVDGTRTLNIQGVSGISTEVAKAVQAAIGNLATKDELNAVSRVLNDVILRKLRERGVIGATLT